MTLLRRPREPMSGLTDDEVTILATYNSECYRGLMHTARWRETMRELQRRYDEARPRMGE